MLASELPGERVQRLQYSIASLQDQHSRTLRSVYEQIHALQRKYAQLTHQAAEAEAEAANR